MWTGFLRRRLPARLRRRRGWRPGLHRVRYRVPQANHRRQKGGRRSAAADPIDEIELLRCSPHADISTRSVGLVIDTVVCLTLDKWETVSGQFGGYLRIVVD